jgi:O-antigen ligase
MPAVGRFAVAGIPLVLVPALGAVQGGFHPDTWVWAGALAAWAAALGIVLTDRPGALRATWRWPAIATALLLWTLASALWSANARQSVLEARRTVVYAAVVLALVVLARRQAARTLVAATHIAITGLLAYALLRYLFSPRVYDPFEGYGISQPLGYANAVGILAAMGILLALAAVIEGTSEWHRAFGAATVPPLALVLTLSSSDASWLALGLGIVVVALLSPQLLLLARTVALLVVPVAALVVLGRYSDYATSLSPRVGGPVLAGSAAAAAIAAALVVAAPRRTSPSRPARRRSGAVTAAAVLVVAVVAAVAVAAGGSTEPRSSYSHVAWHEYTGHALLGSGAGTFGHYWLDSGRYQRWGGALDAHSLYLETLAELGPLGLLLLVAFLLYPLRRAAASRSVPGAAVAAGAAVAFLVHAGLDWDWEMPAVVVAGIACLAAMLLADRPAPDGPADPPLPPLARGAALLFAIGLGLAAIAGAATNAEPAATLTNEAPQSGASSVRD